MIVASWLWIPITLWAALAQTLRNAAQRHLSRDLGTVGATSIRFFYGIPFAAIWFSTVLFVTGESLPRLESYFWLWVIVASFAQIFGTAFLLRAMSASNFALGIAYSKTEAVQVALIAVLVFGDRLSFFATLAIAVATIGVLLISANNDAHPIRALIGGWRSRTVWCGLGAGAGFAISAVGFRNATVTLAPTHFVLAAAATLVVAQLLQSTMLAVWLRWREPGTLTRVAKSWRSSLLAGFMGAAATAGWFSAMAIEPVAHVRTLGLSEMIFSLFVARGVFRERLRRIEWVGIGLLTVGLALAALS